MDYASRVVGGKLESLIGDDTGGAKVYREPDGVVLWLKPSSRVTLPPGFGQVGAAGSTVWQGAQTAKTDLFRVGRCCEGIEAAKPWGPAIPARRPIPGPR
ncbi:MAG TPA: hypothetical protein PKB06_06680, partial [Actinotalea sp.]|nr:hypothetical protein [Actinotalea sp.]